MTTTTTNTLVGTFTLAEPTDHRYDISETASRYEAVVLQPGTYEVHASRGYSDRGEARIGALIPGVVTSRYDGAEFFGVGIGNSPQYDRHPDVGQTREVKFGVSADKVEWNDTAGEVLCWRWLTGAWPCKHRFDDPRYKMQGLTLHAHRSLRWTDSLRRQTHRVETPGGLSEWFDDPYALVQRVNELIDSGTVPEVFSVWCDFATGEVKGSHPDNSHK